MKKESGGTNTVQNTGKSSRRNKVQNQPVSIQNQNTAEAVTPVETQALDGFSSYDR